jgi:hypothetical protein
MRRILDHIQRGLPCACWQMRACFARADFAGGGFSSPGSNTTAGAAMLYGS